MNILNQKYSKEVTDITTVSGQYPCMTQTEDGQMYVCFQEYKNGHDTIVAGKLNQNLRRRRSIKTGLCCRRK